MHTAVIAYRNSRLQAWESDDVWTVRLANLQAQASYLDLALAELLGDASEAHRAAARLLAETAGVAEEQETAAPHVRPVQRRPQHNSRGHQLWANPLAFGLRVFAIAVIASTTFMLTTWLSTLR